MEDTCNPKECKLHDLLGGSETQCPNYIESWWVNNLDNSQKLVKDCTSKRLFLMMQMLENRFTGVQQANEQERNKIDYVLKMLGDFVRRSDVANLPNITPNDLIEAQSNENGDPTL